MDETSMNDDLAIFMFTFKNCLKELEDDEREVALNYLCGVKPETADMKPLYTAFDHIEYALRDFFVGGGEKKEEKKEEQKSEQESSQIGEDMKNNYLTYWQRKLGLLDWVIKLKVNQLPEDMPPDATGYVDYVTASRTACIRILDPRCYNKERVLPFDFEKTLLHELLHLKFAVLDGIGGELGEMILHQLIDEFSVILNGYNIYDREHCEYDVEEA